MHSAAQRSKQGAGRIAGTSASVSAHPELPVHARGSLCADCAGDRRSDARPTIVDSCATARKKRTGATRNTALTPPRRSLSLASASFPCSFKCAADGVAIGEGVMFHVHENRVYCEAHFENLFLQRCHGCKDGLSDSAHLHVHACGADESWDGGGAGARSRLGAG